MKYKNYCGVIFDLDGTITDSKEGIIDSLEYSLIKAGAGKIKRDFLKHYIGEPLKMIYREVLDTEDLETIERAIIYYREYFSKNGIKKNKVYPNLPKILERTHKNNKMIFLTTIKPRIYAKKILRMFNLADNFNEVFGSEMDGKNSSKKDLIHLALSKWSKKCSGEFIMVGDRSSDIEGAKLYNLDSIGVKYGYSKSGEIERAKPTFIAATTNELEKIFAEIGLTRSEND